MSGTRYKGCPWCGGPATFEVDKVNNRGEPYYVIKLGCWACAVYMTQVSNSKDVTDATAVNGARCNTGKTSLLFDTAVAAAVLNNRLARRWNTRVDDIA